MMLRYLYIVLFYLALPWVFGRLLWRSRRKLAYRQRWAERLGYTPKSTDKCIWLHAASVGETLAAVPLIKTLKEQYPTLPILITNMTVTGGERTQAIFGDSVLSSYIPYDLPDAVARFLNRVNPVVAIILETELWPNLFAACQARHIPIIVANARLSEKSASGYQRIAPLTRTMLQTIDTLAVQTQIEADRFVALGLPSERAQVTGNIKFDIEVPADLAAKSILLREQLGKERLLWVAASTHAPEEEWILATHKKILEKYPEALLILIPRHPERFDSIFSLIQQQGLQTVRRSSGMPCAADTQVYLADTMGEMLLMYAVCDVAFVGGSFAPVGGHNMLEAAVLGKPVVTGPQLFNFAEISRALIAAQGMVKVADADELTAVLLKFFADENYRHQTGAHALAFVAANRGALAKQLSYTKSVIDKKLAVI